MEWKSIGIVRNVDNFGRISIPKEMREVLAINLDEPLEIFTSQDNGDEVIILRKFDRGCLFCGNMENILPFKGKKVCQACLRQILAELG